MRRCSPVSHPSDSRLWSPRQDARTAAPAPPLYPPPAPRGGGAEGELRGPPGQGGGAASGRHSGTREGGGLGPRRGVQRPECEEPTQACVTSSPQRASPGCGGGWEAGRGWRRQTEGRELELGPATRRPVRGGPRGARPALLRRRGAEVPRKNTSTGFSILRGQVSGEAGLCRPGIQPWTTPEKPREGDGNSPRVGVSLACSRPEERVESLARSRHSPYPTAPGCPLCPVSLGPALRPAPDSSTRSFSPLRQPGWRRHQCVCLL